MGDGGHSGSGGTGSARRRRGRRLRQHLRHEQLTLCMVLAVTQHHSAPREPEMARTRGEESETKYTAEFQKTPLHEAQSTTQRPSGPRKRGSQNRVALILAVVNKPRLIVESRSKESVVPREKLAW